MTTAAPDTSALPPTVRGLWSRSRGPLLALLLLVISGVAIAALQSGEQHGRLDPRSYDRTGSRAIAQLLASHDVSTQVVTTSEEAAAAAGPHTTLLVTNPEMLTQDQLTGLHTATAHTPGRTVLLAPDSTALETFAPGVRTASPADISARRPACSLPEARRAGSALLGGLSYTTSASGTDRCYLSGDRPTLLRLPAPRTGRDTVLLGSPDLLYNHHLAEHGNASLALQLLGTHKHLVWYLPSMSDPSSAQDNQRGFLDLVPSGWYWALLQLTFAAALAALWRARRLGPLVPEKLPVTVPAAETTEGHARLYEQANARDRASSVLRSATRTRLAPLIGVSPAHAHTPDILLPALHAHLTTAPGVDADLHVLLFGPAPADDKALVHLADQLDELESSIVSQERHAPREHPDR
ncbi:DUF4350 domain-containing protein [Streptomyces sp. Isolate_219]|uniref:DUF4350 domain-containing protein n=1 Tax=Streptomyces sp. Isolate_219 TaxID=2950110 RepID=UPI0021C93E70|nr:DUF4350 domain-containing protein [Streptomyces sp. Isolate_219]MCR8578965.1 DUF4350 domain-containing protein [Streptomyces sp. Isolate_219]